MANLSEIDVVILCGGIGKRLRDSIGESQKSMAKIGDRPFLDIVLKCFVDQGIRRVVLCTGYKSREVEDYYKQNSFGLDIEFSNEAEPLGTGGAIKNARSFVKSDPFFALNGDSFCAINYEKFLDFYIQKKANAAIAVSKVVDRKDYGSILIDDSKRIVSFEEKNASSSEPDNRDFYINAGVYCFSNKIFSLMPEKKLFSVEYDFFAEKFDNDFFGFEVQNEFVDIGTPSRLEKAKEFFENKGGE